MKLSSIADIIPGIDVHVYTYTHTSKYVHTHSHTHNEWILLHDKVLWKSLESTCGPQGTDHLFWGLPRPSSSPIITNLFTEVLNNQKLADNCAQSVVQSYKGLRIQCTAWGMSSIGQELWQVACSGIHTGKWKDVVTHPMIKKYMDRSLKHHKIYF